MAWRHNTPHRTLCDTLEQMRQCHKTHNYAHLLGLIEEAQTMADRIEAALYEKDDYREWRKKVKKEKQEFRRLLKKTNKLRKIAKEDKKEFPEY